MTLFNSTNIIKRIKQYPRFGVRSLKSGVRSPEEGCLPIPALGLLINYINAAKGIAPITVDHESTM